MAKDSNYEMKLYLKTDVEGYITAVAQEPHEGHLETEMTMAQFIAEYAGTNITDGRHRYCNGQIVEDGGTTRSRAIYEETLRETLRQNRACICFPVVNRGQVWYNSLSEEQKNELESWYQAWLDAPETLNPPETPKWLKI